MIAPIILLTILTHAPTDTITIESLLDEMVDLEGLTHLPEIPYVAKQASSYDRKSITPDDHAGWFANRDAGQYIRVENEDSAELGAKRYVMMDEKGPGVVTRIWSANPKGILRIHIDGKVVVGAPMADLLQGKVEPFTTPFAYNASRGCNIYFPFPYMESCKITSDDGDFYYQIGYRTYPEGTRLEVYAPDLLPDLEMAMSYVRKVLEDPTRAEPPRLALAFDEGSFALTSEEGPGYAHGITIRHGIEDPEVLRKTIMIMKFDGIETVRVPLGDFFGSGPGINPFTTLPFMVKEDGTLICRWVMPFRKTMAIDFEGEGKKSIEGDVTVELAPWEEGTMYFHATWRQEYDIPTEKQRDWNYLTVTGKGVYVGNTLNIANPARHWWGEGDEKIYVDGETFPSHFGTGTEDYYGYAWGCPEPFMMPYHSQPRCDGPANYGHTSLNRFHILDSIPFEKSLRFDMEVWHIRRDVKVSYESVNYYYALPGAKDTTPAFTIDDLRIPVLPECKYLIIEGAIEGEGMRSEVTGGNVTRQDLTYYGESQWSRDLHLWWKDAKEGDSAGFFFEAPEEGEYRVIAYCTKAPDYGVHELAVNVDKGVLVDFWHEKVAPTGPIDLGVHTLEKTGNVLRVKVIGTNPKAEPANLMFGLDCIVLKRGE